MPKRENKQYKVRSSHLKGKMAKLPFGNIRKVSKKEIKEWEKRHEQFGN